MKTVTLEVCAPEQALSQALLAAKSNRRANTARVSFATPELLWLVLTAMR